MHTAATTAPADRIDTALERLCSILRRARPHGSVGELAFAEDVLMPYQPDTLKYPLTTRPSFAFREATPGETLAYTIDILNDDGTTSRTMFSCHIDTVGRSEKDHDLIGVDDRTIGVSAKNDCLGADDGAGVWLMLEMIDAKVPGCYVFHRGEERGGIGSSGVARHHTDFLAGFDRAIAFDRRGTHSVITHQGFGRCCSDEFGEALATAFNDTIDETYFFAPDAGGVFTDTANYTDDIPECTNVSIGYEHEHSSDETLDIHYLFALREACLKIDWEALPTKRKPGESDLDWGTPSRHHSSASTWRDAYEGSLIPPSVADLANYDFPELVEYVEYGYPDDVATVLWNLLHRDDISDKDTNQ